MWQQVSKYFARRPPPWGAVTIKLFQNMVMLQIKSKGMTNTAACKRILCPYTHPRPLGWGKMSLKTFYF